MTGSRPTSSSSRSRSTGRGGGGAAVGEHNAAIDATIKTGLPRINIIEFADRNYALMGGANMIVSLGMLGTMLPLTLYLQEALGFSALKTGLTMVPSSLASMVVAPLDGRPTGTGSTC